MAGKEAGRVRRWFGTLSPTERLVLLLHYSDQLTDHEIAAVLDRDDTWVRHELDRLRDVATCRLADSGMMITPAGAVAVLTTLLASAGPVLAGAV